MTEEILDQRPTAVSERAHRVGSSRRWVIELAGAVAVLSVAAKLIRGPVAAAVEKLAGDEPVQDDQRGYRASEHVRRYYRSLEL